MGKGKSKKRIKLTASTADKHVLYEQSVQSVDSNIEFMAQAFKEYAGRDLVSICEDFCGTACLSCAWIESGDGRTAVRCVQLCDGAVKWWPDRSVELE